MPLALAKSVALTIFLLLPASFAVPVNAQTATGTRTWAYEVVSIKEERPDAGAVGFRKTPTGFEASSVSLRDMIKEAYGLQDVSMVIHAPEWKTRYHVVAKLGSDTIAALEHLSPQEQSEKTHLMQQALLAEDFHLAVHQSQQPLAVYSLEVDGKGASLKRVTPGAEDSIEVNTFFGDGRITGVYSMSQLVHVLSIAHLIHIDGSDRPVMDDTGLSGNYRIDLAWTPLAGSQPEELSRDTEVYSSLESALKGSLGLKLAPRKIDAESIVVDRAERPVLD